MGGANVTLQCHLMSGDFEDADQYTPIINDNPIQDKEIDMSDHLDAPGMKPPNMDASVDICDIYAFQKPGDALPFFCDRWRARNDRRHPYIPQLVA